MGNRFGGIPVEENPPSQRVGGRFGGIPVEDPPEIRPTGPNRQRIAPDIEALAQQQIPEGDRPGIMDFLSAAPWNQGAIANKVIQQNKIENARKDILDAEELDRRLNAAQAAGIDMSAIDSRTGASGWARNSVGGSPLRDREANLKQYYADTIPDPEMIDNFLYKNPETGQWTRYNPRGFDMGDIPSVGRDIAVNVGGDIAALLTGAGSAAAVPATGGTSLAALGTVPAAYGAGGAAGGALYDTVMNNIFGRVDTRSGLERMADTGIDFAGNALGAGIGTAGTAAGKAFLGAGKNQVQKGLQKVLVGDTTKAAQALSELTDLGIQPTLDMISNRNLTKAAASTLGTLPGSSDVMQNVAEKNLGVLENNLGGLVRQYTGGKDPLSAQGIGGAIRSGVEKSKEGYESAFKKSYDDFFSGLAPEAKAKPVDVLALRAARKEEQFAKELPSVAAEVQDPKVTGLLDKFLLDSLPGKKDVAIQGVHAPQKSIPEAAGMWTEPQSPIAEKFSDRLVKSLMKEAGAQPKDLSAQTFRETRSHIGNLQAKRNSDWDARELKRLYGALSGDIETAVAKDSPEKLQKLLELDKNYNTYGNEVRPMLDDIIDKGTDEQIFQLATKNNKLGGQQLQKIFSNIAPEERGLVAGSFLDRLARKGGEFSPKNMATQWDSLAPEAKNVMFGAENAPLRTSLDRLMAGIKRMESTTAFANPSGTNRHLMISALISDLPTSIAAGAAVGLSTGDPKLSGLALLSPTAGRVIAQRGVAKLLTNPKFVNWMANQTHARPPMSKKNLLTRIGRIYGTMKADGLKEEMDRYTEAALAAFDKEQSDAKNPQRNPKQQSR